MYVSFTHHLKPCCGALWFCLRLERAPSPFLQATVYAYFCRTNKNRLMWQWLWKCCCCCCCAPAPPVMATGESAQWTQAAQRYSEHQRGLQEVGEQLKKDRVALYPPGNVVHLKPKSDGGWDMAWTDGPGLGEIQITMPHMLRDHMPDRVLNALQGAVTGVPGLVEC